MSNKLFEERVRAELNDFELNPDAAIWTGIEAQLQNKTKKRSFVWFILLGVLVGVGSLLYQFNNSTEPSFSSNAIQSVTQKKNSIISLHQPSMVKIMGEKKWAESNEKNNLDIETNPKDAQLLNMITVAKNGINKPIEVSQYVITQPGITTNNESENKTSLASVPAIMEGQLKPDNNITVQPLLKDSLPIIAKVDSLTIPMNKMEKTNHKWTWSIAATAGISLLRASLFEGEKTYNMDRYSNNFSVVQVPVNMGVFNYPIISTANSYSFSVQSERMLGKRAGLQLALGYTLYRNKILVGTKVTTTPSAPLLFLADNAEKMAQNNFYYSNSNSNQQNEYTNQYHLLHFTSSAFRVLKLGKSISLRMNVGLSGSYLFASNGLHYISNKDVLLQNNTLLNKWQMGAVGSMELGIGKKPWVFVGPEFRYQFTNLSVLDGTSQHLGLAGMRARINIPTKSKQVQR